MQHEPHIACPVGTGAEHPAHVFVWAERNCTCDGFTEHDVVTP